MEKNEIDPTTLLQVGASALGTVAGVADSRAARRFAKQQSDIAWNRQLAMYEDAKLYNTYENQLKRWREAGLSPYAFAGSSSNASPSSVHMADVPTSTGFGALQKGLESLSDILSSHESRKLRREQMKIDRDYKEEMIKYQKASLEALKSYRTSVLEQGNRKIDLQSSIADMENFWNEKNYRWRDDFYTKSSYPGYWQRKSSEQNFNFNKTLNPIKADIMRVDLNLKRKFAAQYSEMLRLENLIRTHRASMLGRDDYIASELYQDEIADKKLMYQLHQSDPSNSGFGKWWNFGVKMANDVGNVVGSWSNILNPYRGKVKSVRGGFYNYY